MFTEVGGLKLHYLTEGHGLPVVVPSLAGSTFYERSFFIHLRNDLVVTNVELRGNRSDTGQVDGLTIEKLSDSFREFLDQIKLKKAVVVAHSGHGFLGMDFAARYPERVSHLILVGATPTFGSDFQAEGAKYWEMLASPERKLLEAENQKRSITERANLSPQEAIVRMYVLGAPRLFFDPHFDCTFLWEGTHASPEIWDRFWGSGGEWKRFDAASTLPAIKCPALIVAGLFDFVVPPTLWYGTKDMIPDSEYVVLDKSGHNPQFEEPQRFNRVVMEWLKRH